MKSIKEQIKTIWRVSVTIISIIFALQSLSAELKDPNWDGIEKLDFK